MKSTSKQSLKLVIWDSYNLHMHSYKFIISILLPEIGWSLYAFPVMSYSMSLSSYPDGIITEITTGEAML